MKKRSLTPVLEYETFDIDMNDIDTHQLGKGSYAMTFKSRSNLKNIYRIEGVHNMRDSLRSVNIHDFISKGDYGPCIPKLYAYKVVARMRLPFHIQEEIKSENFIQYMVTMMEFGDAGDLTAFEFDNDEMVIDMYFMLAWTYWKLNSLYGFMHRDIKQANIVVKRSDKPMVYEFKMEDQIWVITTTVVPMFIDFDFASLLTTRPSKRYMHGTYVTASPESHAYDVLMNKQQMNTYGNQTTNENTYDLWGLAITMMSCFMNLGEKRKQRYELLFFNPTITLNMINYIHGLDKKNTDITPKMVKKATLAKICLLQDFIGNRMFPSKRLVGITYSSLVFTPEFKRKVRMLKKTFKENGIFQNLSKKYKLTDERMMFFAKLLRWDSNKRSANGDPKVFFEHLKPSTGIPFDKRVNFVYIMEDRMLLGMNTDEEFRAKQIKKINTNKYIETSICDGCGVDNDDLKNVCVCCLKIYCNENCHI